MLVTTARSTISFPFEEFMNALDCQQLTVNVHNVRQSQKYGHICHQSYKSSDLF